MTIYLAGTEARGKSLMDVYLAEGGHIFEQRSKMCPETNIFDGVNILQSFYYCNRFTEEKIIPNCKKFLLDSGAFTFLQKGKNPNIDEYILSYADFIKRNKITNFFELDIDSLVGYEKVLYYRKKLEDIVGLPCIPVWHKSRGIEDFVKMCEQYKYVALGGIVIKEFQKSDYKYFPWFIKTAHQNGAMIHGLGFTNLQLLPKYHFDSVDSSTWVAGNRFGIAYFFDGKTIHRVVKKEGERLADEKRASLHNFLEWVKFSKYAEAHL